MSLVLRILLVVMSFISGIYAVREIRKSQMKIENAIYWFALTALFIIVGIFPGLAFYAADLLGVESPVNLVYLIMIFLLFCKVFSLSLKLAQLEHKVNILTSESAIVKNQINEVGKKREN